MGFKKHLIFTRILLICCIFISPFMAANAYDFAAGVFKFQQKLAAKGNPQAQYKLANMYADGQGVKANLNKALLWYTKSAAQNYAPAKTRIVYIEIIQNGYKPNKHNKWLNKLKEDASQNDGESLFLLGTLYKKGFIVPRNYSKAAKLFKRASNKNIPGAEAELESISSILNRQKAKQRSRNKQLQLEAEKKRKEQKALQKKKYEDKKNKQISNQRIERERLAAERERAAIKREKQALSTEKRQLIEKRRTLLLKQAQAQAEQRKKQNKTSTDAEEAPPATIKKEAPPAPAIIKKKKFDRSICRGSKARFLTICR